jgi:hypothetical protein
MVPWGAGDRVGVSVVITLEVVINYVAIRNGTQWETNESP